MDRPLEDRPFDWIDCAATQEEFRPLVVLKLVLQLVLKVGPLLEVWVSFLSSLKEEESEVEIPFFVVRKEEALLEAHYLA